MNHLSIIRNTLLASAVCIALIASIYKLSEAPAIWYDEGFYTQIAMHFAEAGKQALQIAPGVYVPTSYITVGYPLIFPLSISYNIFGVGVLAGRGVMVLFLLGFVLASYVLVRKLFGSWVAAWTTLLLATFPMLYGNGKSVLGEVPGLFFLVLSLLALHYLEKTNYRDWRWYVAVGFFAGVCAATKPFFILLLVALCITLALRWSNSTLNWYGVFLGAIALILPLGLWAYLQFGTDTSLHGVLAEYANPYASNNLFALMLHNALRFVRESTPLYTLIMMTVWGTALFIRKGKKSITAVELAAFTFCTLAIASYLRLEGWYRYLFPAITIALLFFPASLQTTATFASSYVGSLRKLMWLPFALVTLLSGAQLYQLAFSSYIAQYYASSRTRSAAQALSHFTPTTSFFLYNTPEVAILLPSREYYQYLTPTAKVTIGEDELSALARGAADVVIVNSDTYTTHPDLFNRYHLKETVDRYAILQK